MVAHLSGTDLAVAGHAVALAGWHQVIKTCTVPLLWSALSVLMRIVTDRTHAGQWLLRPLWGAHSAN